ncbi:MAG: hypothetical protein HYX69_00565 [Planctomycetia bacterium]|nr:hypothetical protein [Planctomycetia bacterium]
MSVIHTSDTAARACGARVLLACTCLAALSFAPRAAAQDPPAEPAPPQRFYEQEPYDLVTIKDAKNTELKTVPLSLPDRKVPSNPQRGDKLRLRRFDEPDEEFDVLWQNVASVKLFEQMILDEAKRLAAAGNFNEAFDYFGYLEAEYPKVDGLPEAVADFLYEEAKHWQRNRSYENALVLLHTLYDRQPKRAGLEAAIGAATAKLIEKHLQAEDYRSVRRLVREIKARFPDGAVAAQFERQLTERSAGLVAEGRQQLEAGEPRQALANARRALVIWPATEGARELAEKAFAALPQIVVGVTTPFAPLLTDPITDWPAQRTRRLVDRRLFEFIGYGANGGEYICPFGRFEITELGRGLSIQIAPNLPWSHENNLTGYDVARRLLALAQRGQPDFRPDWAEAFARVDVRDVYAVDIRLHEAHVLPMALLTVPLASPRRDADAPPTAGAPYVPRPSTPELATFRLEENYFARTAGQPREIVERRFPTRSAAVDALRKGDVALVDRVPPWDVTALKGDAGLVVEPYCVPALHCLVPNLARPFLAHRAFRRALVYGIDRQRILTEQLLRRQQLPGSLVTSGAFAKGAGLADPMGYAYNDRIEPRPYEPRLAMTLAAVALRDLATAAEKDAQELKQFPTLTLAHPADDVALTACKGIQKNLGAIGLKVELREIPPGQPTRLAEGDDLVYVELSVDEPLVAARRLFGEDGICGVASSYMSLALRQVDAATGWNEARAALHDVHRIVHEEVTIVPLWQLVEHFAYRKSLTGAGTRPATLYQNVEQWQATVPLPEEQP